jgi:GNAT superfamily N-acetyltransferase
MGRRLSRQTLYRRFFAGVIRLPAGFVADLAERSADVVHLGAVAVRTGAVVGLATWARTEAGAEVALLVEDGYQGAGVGRLLACALAARCRAAGERLLVADVLSAHVRAAVCLARPHVCAVHVDYEGEVARLSAELAPLRPA